MAKIYKVDGTVQVVEKISWDEMKAAIGGGLVQLVPLHGTEDMRSIACDEEGKMKGMPFNGVATDKFGKYLFSGDYLAGDVVEITEDELRAMDED